MMILLILVVGVLTLIYYLVLRPFTYWTRKNVPVGKITPVFGDMYNIAMGLESSGEMLLNTYNKVPDTRYVGAYIFHVPTLILKDPELIKQICVKNADCFYNHGQLLMDSEDYLWKNALFPQRDQDWKNSRATMIPTQTLNKVKMMFPLICKQLDCFISYMKEQDQEIVETEFGDLSLRLYNDILSSTAFGVEVDSFREKTNEMFVISSNTCDLGLPWKKFVIFVYQIFPSLGKFFKLSMFSKKAKDFYLKLVEDTIKSRKNENIKRSDLIGFFMDLKDEQAEKIERKRDLGENITDVMRIRENLSVSSITSKAFVMYFAYIDNVVKVLSFLAYELALNPDIQKKLIEEIDEHRTSDGSPDWDVLQNLSYMDMVVNETHRKWPGTIASDRLVTKPYTIPPELPHEKPVHLDVNDNIMLPIYGIHRDPRYHPNPDKFDPERFSPENKKKMHPYSFIPFGAGPRMCIGLRFSNISLKVTLFYILSNFEIVPTKDTKVPLNMCKTNFGLFSADGFPLGLKRRK